MWQEPEVKCGAGWCMVGLVVLVGIGEVAGFVKALQEESGVLALGAAFLFVMDVICFFGLTVVNPNRAKVMTLFGSYTGSLKQPGFYWVNPLTSRKNVSLRVRNFESGKLKVNDREGNPIEIAAIVVWRIVETFEAIFNVDDYEHFVHVQTEAAVRILATTYAYDAHEDGQLSLRSSVGEITDRLRHEGHERLATAGIGLIETGIRHPA